MRPVMLALVLVLGACSQPNEGATLRFFPMLLGAQATVKPEPKHRFKLGERAALVAVGRPCAGKTAFVELLRDGQFVVVTQPITVKSDGHWWTGVNTVPGNYKAVLYLDGKREAESEFVVEP